MNLIWGMMVMIGIGYGVLTGQAELVSDEVLSSAKEAVSLCITMLGIMAFWSGMMEVAEDAGLVQFISMRIRPLLRLLFPHIPAEHPACEQISMNCVANFLGLGWAATPAGLKAMKSLEELEQERRRKWEQDKDQKRKKGIQPVMAGTANNEMCNFLILNISSLQLIPVSVIAYRSQYGSVSPAVITGPAIVATAVSTGVGILFCCIMNYIKLFRKKSK